MESIEEEYPIEIPQEIRDNYLETLDELNDAKVELQRMEHSLVKATKQRKKDIKNKIRKTQRIIDLQSDRIEELISKYPSLKNEMTPQLSEDKEVPENPSVRVRTYSNEDRTPHGDSHIKFVRQNDHSIVRKNHWPEDADHTSKDQEDLIYLWTEDEESSNAQMRQSNSRSTPEPNPRNYSSLTMEFFDATVADWKEHCRLQDFVERQDSYRQELSPPRSPRKTERRHFNVNVLNQRQTFDQFMDARLRHIDSSPTQKTRMNPPGNQSREQPSGHGDSSNRSQQSVNPTTVPITKVTRGIIREGMIAKPQMETLITGINNRKNLTLTINDLLPEEIDIDVETPLKMTTIMTTIVKTVPNTHLRTISKDSLATTFKCSSSNMNASPRTNGTTRQTTT